MVQYGSELDVSEFGKTCHNEVNTGPKDVAHGIGTISRIVRSSLYF